MKRLFLTLFLLVVLAVQVQDLSAAVRVRGYSRKDGTYVQPHWRSNPDGNFYNNWSTYPNINPYTGTTGTKRFPSYYHRYSWSLPSYTSQARSYWQPNSYGNYQSFPKSFWDKHFDE